MGVDLCSYGAFAAFGISLFAIFEFRLPPRDASYELDMDAATRQSTTKTSANALRQTNPRMLPSSRRTSLRPTFSRSLALYCPSTSSLFACKSFCSTLHHARLPACCSDVSLASTSPRLETPHTSPRCGVDHTPLDDSPARPAARPPAQATYSHARMTAMRRHRRTSVSSRSTNFINSGRQLVTTASRGRLSRLAGSPTEL